jgi:molybdate-binding protein
MVNGYEKALLEAEDVAFLADGRVDMTVGAKRYMGDYGKDYSNNC